MSINHQRLIEALRDTAAKVTETVEFEVPDFAAEMASPHFNRAERLTRKDVRELYSKDWIAGRLLGMADTLEPMLQGDDQ
jgi:hypothetical protein